MCMDAGPRTLLGCAWPVSGLHRAGYRYFAIETDPQTAQFIEDRLRHGGLEALLSGTSHDPPGRLWGLDQAFIGTYGPLLDALRTACRYRMKRRSGVAPTMTRLPALKKWA
jgi:hypothetical protein